MRTINYFNKFKILKKMKNRSLIIRILYVVGATIVSCVCAATTFGEFYVERAREKDF